jgi:Ca2+-binding RTX toxin-like protein
MKLLTDDVLLASAVDASAIAPQEEEIKGDRILSYGLDTRSASQLGASSSFISTFDGLSGQVGTIDPSAKFTQIASTFSFSDIAVSKDGTIFGITPTQLFKIDPVSGLTSFVGGLPAGVNMNALEFANDILYGAGDSNLYAINTTNAGVYLIANLESTGFNSSGDLAFDAPNNRFLATSKGATSDSLYAVSLTGQAAKIGDIGFSNILALMFEGEKLFGFTADGARIAIDPGTGAGVFDTLVNGISDRIGGASGIQIKKGEVLSSTPGTILSADTIDVFLPPGGEIILEITVTVPGDGSEPIRSVRSIENGERSASAVTNQLPLDVFLLQDLSNSFDNDLPVVQKLVPNLVSRLQSIQPNTTFGVGSFIDKPILPFGKSADSDYVYRTNLPLTTDTSALQSTVNNFIIRSGNDDPEAQLEGLLQTALRSQSEIGFRDSSRRVVVVATDAEFHQAGDGREAGITKLNNLDTIFDGNPPGTGEDYPSVPQVRQALINANLVPVFAVTEDQIATYRDLVDDSDGDGLGFGSVVELKSDSSNLVDAIATGLDVVGREINVVPVSDKFGYVKEIMPPKFTDVLPGQKLTFRVKLKSDGKGGDDTLNLRALGFGDTKINVKTVVPNQPIVTKLPNAPQITEIKDSYISGKISDDTNNDKFFSNDAKDRESRPVTIKTFNGAKVDPNAETWIVIHGNADNPNKDKIFDLAKAVEEQVEGKKGQVLVIDWSDSANNKSLGQPDPFLSSNWISDVANFAVEALRDEWKIASEKINLIGHSLGTYVASEIGFLLSSRDKDRSKLNIDPDKRVNTIIALDPAVNDPRNALGYDLDGDTNDIRETPIPFSPVSKFSRAFWGDIASGDGTGSSDYATSANESIYIDFKRPTENPGSGRDNLIPFDSHGNMVYLYRNILKNPGEIGSLFKLDAGEHKEWKKDSYEGNEAILVATAYKDEGKFDYKPFNGNDPNTEPKFLFFKDAQPQNDGIAYGSTGDDKLDGIISDTKIFLGLSQVNDAGNDKLYGDSGNDEIFSGSGNDTLYGSSGNDFINSEQDNDLIEGGDDNDTIFGAKGDDTVIGGKGNDSLEGNGDDDTLIGGKGKDNLTGGFGSDIFVFSPGDGAASRDEADIITDFGTGFVGTGGADRIGLAGGLKADSIELETFGGGIFGIGERTALKANGQYLAVLNSKFSKNDLNFLENFSIV